MRSSSARAVFRSGSRLGTGAVGGCSVTGCAGGGGDGAGGCEPNSHDATIKVLTIRSTSIPPCASTADLDRSKRGATRSARQYNRSVRYLVTARVKRGREDALARAVDDGSLGQGSIAGGEYLRNMQEARQLDDGRVKWVEVCYCPTPL